MSKNDFSTFVTGYLISNAMNKKDENSIIDGFLDFIMLIVYTAFLIGTLIFLCIIFFALVF